MSVISAVLVIHVCTGVSEGRVLVDGSDVGGRDSVGFGHVISLRPSRQNSPAAGEREASWLKNWW